MISDSLRRRKHEGVPSAPNGTRFLAAVLLRNYSVDLNNSRFGVPFTFPVITPDVELVMIQFETVADGWSPKVAL